MHIVLAGLMPNSHHCNFTIFIHDVACYNNNILQAVRHALDTNCVQVLLLAKK